MRKQTKRFLVPCAAAAFTIGASMMSFAATGWNMEGGAWRYYDSSGSPVTDSWKKSGNSWFWLDEDGEMAVSTLVEDDGNFYYVNESGVMVANQWREFDNEDRDEDASDTCWYYFGPSGKAYKAADSGKTTFKSIVKADGTTRKYAFDNDGKMLYGWVDDQSERQTGEDAWKTGIYYLGDAGDGAMRAEEWARLEAEDDENEDEDFDGYHWFYFRSNGKKLQDTTKTINGKKYRFRENGDSVFNWYNRATPDTASPNNLFYSQPSDSWLSQGWFKTVPGEDIDPEGYESGDEYWFYANKDGELTKSKIKKINGYYYGFNEYGEMLEGLYKLSINDGEIQSYEKIESESDLPEADDAWDVYYFADSPKAGAMKTGNATLDIDGEKYTYSFKKSGDERGKGYHGVNDGSLYIKGKMMKADKDAKLEVFEFNGDDDEGGRYLINTSGKIQKGKKNVKDADDHYYCTDSRGIVTYEGNEKWAADKE